MLTVREFDFAFVSTSSAPQQAAERCRLVAWLEQTFFSHRKIGRPLALLLLSKFPAKPTTVYEEYKIVFPFAASCEIYLDCPLLPPPLVACAHLASTLFGCWWHRQAHTFWVNFVVVVVVVDCVAQYLRGTCCVGKLLHTFSTSRMAPCPLASRLRFGTRRGREILVWSGQSTAPPSVVAAFPGCLVVLSSYALHSDAHHAVNGPLLAASHGGQSEPIATRRAARCV